MCYQGFVECFLNLSSLLFNEHTLEQSLKSMIYYCKYYLKQDGNSKLSQYFDIEINELLFPISQKLLDSINNNHDTKFQNNSSNNFKKSDYIVPIESEKLVKAKADLNSNDISNSNQINFSNEKTNSVDLNKKMSKKSLFPIFFDTNY